MKLAWEKGLSTCSAWSQCGSVKSQHGVSVLVGVQSRAGAKGLGQEVGLGSRVETRPQRTLIASLGGFDVIE